MKKLLLVIAAVIFTSFTAHKKPLMVQAYKLVSHERNEKEQIIKVKYEKVGEPYLMPDSALKEIVHVIIND